MRSNTTWPYRVCITDYQNYVVLTRTWLPNELSTKQIVSNSTNSDQNLEFNLLLWNNELLIWLFARIELLERDFPLASISQRFFWKFLNWVLPKWRLFYTVQNVSRIFCSVDSQIKYAQSFQFRIYAVPWICVRFHVCTADSAV